MLNGWWSGLVRLVRGLQSGGRAARDLPALHRLQLCRRRYLIGSIILGDGRDWGGWLRALRQFHRTPPRLLNSDAKRELRLVKRRVVSLRGLRLRLGVRGRGGLLELALLGRVLTLLKRRLGVVAHNGQVAVTGCATHFHQVNRR